MSVANQRIVKIKKEKCNRDNLYCMIDMPTLQAAMQNLKGESFKLWMYFSKNQNTYQFELSQKECLKWGIKKDAYYAAVEKLISLGYLNPISPDSNIYVFSEKPNMADSEKPIYFSENQTAASEISNNISEKPERNITNITKILNDSTPAIGIPLEERFYADGYIPEKNDWIDNLVFDFDGMSYERQLREIEKLGFSEEESQIALDDIYGR